MRAPLLALLLASSLAGGLRAGDPEGKLGAAFREAPPGEQLVLLAEAELDKLLTHAEVVAANERVVRAALAAGDGAQARLELLGQLRGAARDKLAAVNAARKEAGKPGAVAGFAIEPDATTQEALVVEFVAATAGPDPAPEKLVCLETVRQQVQLLVYQRLTTFFLEQALRRDEAWAGGDAATRKARLEQVPDAALPSSMRGTLELVFQASAAFDDAAYRKGDLEAKLKRVKAIPAQELPQREAVVSSLLVDWLTGRLAAGEQPAALEARLKALRKAGTLTTSTYAERLLARLGELRGKKK